MQILIVGADFPVRYAGLGFREDTDPPPPPPPFLHLLDSSWEHSHLECFVGMLPSLTSAWNTWHIRYLLIKLVGCEFLKRSGL